VGSAGTVDNVVNSSLAIGSLTYGQTNNYHTTLIAPNQTLTVGGDTGGLLVGTGADSGSGQLTTAAITGAGGTLLVTNTSANIFVSQNHPVTSGESTAQATLDMSGLDKFSATVARLLVGVDLVIKGGSGVLNLAKTNTITVTTGSAAPQIDVGDNTLTQGSAAVPSILLLGKTNGFFADSIAVGRGKTDLTGSSMSFNSIFASPTAYFRGTSGASSRVGTWSIGDAYGSKVTTFPSSVGTCDFSLGTVDALVGTMYVGKGADANIASGANITGRGTLTIGAGTMDINTLQAGVTVTATGTGTINVNGGTLLVNTSFLLANGSGSSGTLNVSNGIVTANGGITASGGTATINLVGGTLNATNPTATIGTLASPLNSFSVSNSTLNLSVQSLVTSIAANNLTANGTANTINVKTAPLLMGFPSQFPVIQYGLNGGSGSGNLDTFVLGTLPAGSPPYGAYISNNVANNSIDIVFTNGPSIPALTWDGTPNGNWNTSTTNWRPKTGPNVAYAQGNFVTFDDSLAGTPNVNLTTALTPATLTVSNDAAAYAFSGTGSLGGSMTLVKYGPGTLSLAETGVDNFSGGILVTNGTLILDNANGNITGGTTISGGTVQIGNNDTKGALPLGNVTDGGALVFSRANNIIVSNAISGAGTITQSNTGVVTLSGNSSFSGTATVAAGTLQVGNTNGLGLATSVTVNSGATFDIGGFALFGNGNTALAVTVSGAGVGGNGALVNNSTNNSTRTLHTVTLAADTTFGGTGDWEIRNTFANSSTPADGSLNGAFNLTKVGTNALSLRGVNIDPSLGDINVQGGSMTITATTAAPQNSLGSSSATATVFSNATLTLDTIGIIPGKNFVLTNGGTLKSSATNILNNSSSLTLVGPANNTISANSGNQLTITTAIGGGGGFSKNGGGVLFLAATNTYSGNTVVSSGTLALYGGGSDGSISSSVNININGGAILDVSGRSDGTFTLMSGQTLIGGVGGNSGAINGSFVAGSGSVFAPGSGTTNTGSITVSSNATLQGATTMKLNAATGANDRLTANAITYGGSLSVTNFSGAITNGQTFQLFASSNGVYNAGTFTSITLPTATGLTWTTNLAVNGSIVATVAAGPTGPGQLTNSVSGNTLSLSWPPGQGWRLQTQTNSLSTGLQPNGWVYMTDGSASSTNLTMDATKPTVFFRLTYP
jgi:autotransporter-associated beta strand protein